MRRTSALIIMDGLARRGWSTLSQISTATGVAPRDAALTLADLRHRGRVLEQIPTFGGPREYTVTPYGRHVAEQARRKPCIFCGCAWLDHRGRATRCIACEDCEAYCDGTLRSVLASTVRIWVRR